MLGCGSGDSGAVDDGAGLGAGRGDGPGRTGDGAGRSSSVGTAGWDGVGLTDSDGLAGGAAGSGSRLKVLAINQTPTPRTLRRRIATAPISMGIHQVLPAGATVHSSVGAAGPPVGTAARPDQVPRVVSGGSGAVWSGSSGVVSSGSGAVSCGPASNGTVSSARPGSSSGRLGPVSRSSSCAMVSSVRRLRHRSKCDRYVQVGREAGPGPLRCPA